MEGTCTGDGKQVLGEYGRTSHKWKEDKEKASRGESLIECPWGNWLLFSRTVTFKFVQLVQVGTILFCQRAGYWRLVCFQKRLQALTS